MPISDGKKTVSARIEAQQREQIKTKGGTFNTIRYEVFVFNGVLYSRKLSYLSGYRDDARRLPVQIRARMGFPIGSITFELQKEEHSYGINRPSGNGRPFAHVLPPVTRDCEFRSVCRPARQSTAPTKPGKVDGVVIDSITNNPVKKAMVVLNSPGTAHQLFRSYSHDRHFQFHSADPGKTCLMATCDGFIPQQRNGVFSQLSSPRRNKSRT